MTNSQLPWRIGFSAITVQMALNSLHQMPQSRLQLIYPFHFEQYQLKPLNQVAGKCSSSCSESCFHDF